MGFASRDCTKEKQNDMVQCRLEKLNFMIINNLFLLPRMKGSEESLGDKQLFSTLDPNSDHLPITIGGRGKKSVILLLIADFINSSTCRRVQKKAMP